jgi:hypothetical protein
MNSVVQIEPPRDARALSTLARIDYADAFLVHSAHWAELTPEQWARLILEQAALPLRSALLSGWSALGLKLGPGGILGWTVRRSRDDYVLLGAESLIGMPAELLLKHHRAALLFCTFVQHDNVAARGVWAAVEPLHVPIVRRVLTQGVERAEAAAAHGHPMADAASTIDGPP